MVTVSRVPQYKRAVNANKSSLSFLDEGPIEWSTFLPFERINKRLKYLVLQCAVKAILGL